MSIDKEYKQLLMDSGVDPQALADHAEDPNALVGLQTKRAVKARHILSDMVWYDPDDDNE
jgi:hypothetical protein